MITDPMAGDTNPANNKITYWLSSPNTDCIGAPLAFNEKSVYPDGDIMDTQKLTYTIHFQNTGTSIATNVVITDTINKDLDMTTLKVVSSSFPVSTGILPGRVVKFTFAGINLPDTAMSKTSSAGVVQFTIKPGTYVFGGDHITNTANIYFDANPVIKTNTTMNMLLNGLPIGIQNVAPLLKIACFPNPFLTFTTVVFNSSGKHYVEVDDIAGRKLKAVECNGSQYELSSNGLAAGVYFIKVYDDTQKFIATTKIVIE
jgi:uncharacterized repeat protein (TIGR01451 family)